MSPPTSRRNFLKLSAGLSAAAVLAACAAPAPTGGEGDAAMPETVELRLTFWGDLADMPTWNWGIEQWKDERPDIQIKWENTPWGEYWTKLQTEAVADNLPDIVGMVSMFSQQYIRQGSLLSFQSYIDAEPEVDVADFWPANMLAYTWQDEIYAFPYDLSTVLPIYNKSMFLDNGVELPIGDWTWDEFQETCIALTQDTSGDGNTDQWGWLMPNLASWTIDIPLSTNGARFVSEDGLKCLLDTPEAIETIQWLSDLRHVHQVSPTIAQQGDVPLFESGRAAMHWGNPERVQTIASRVGPARDNENFLWDVALFPMKTQPGNSVQGGSFAIGATTENPDQSWEFVKFYTSAPILEEMVAKPSRGIPGRASIAQALITDENPEHQQYFLDVLEYSISTFIPAFAQVTAVLAKYMDEIMINNEPAAAILPQAVQEIDPILIETA